MIIPSIDIMNGKAVQLQQGKKLILEKENIFELAKEFRKYGEIAVIDLDAALGKGSNLSIIKKLCKIAPCRVGGGIRSIELANEILQAGAKKIIIGTKANSEFLRQLPKDRIIVAIDSKNNKIVTDGWTQISNVSPIERMKNLEDYCSEFLYTNVEIEGMMKGIDLTKILDIKCQSRLPITIAGGITSIQDVLTLEKLHLNSQIGMAIYTQRIELSEAFINCLDFEKNNGLIPTIVQDNKNQVLMLAYSNEISLRKTFQSNCATYYSRSRDEIWIKGSTSGNIQEFITARYDCDLDSLIFIVKQKNNACHLNRYSCFGSKDFSLRELYELIQSRIESKAEESYTYRISTNEKKIMDKIREESLEVINYESQENLIWEIADLTYFVLTLMVKKNILLDDVLNELWRRRK